MIRSKDRQFIGQKKGELRLVNSSRIEDFDEVFAVVEEAMGIPVICQILSTIPPLTEIRIRSMLFPHNHEVVIDVVPELDLSTEYYDPDP